MNIYYPAGSMAGSGIDDKIPVTVNGGAPLVDPLNLEPCGNKSEAAERVSQHIDFARQDPATWRLQWHAAAIEIYPYNITESTFYRLWMENYPERGEFATEHAYEEFISDVTFSLDKKEDQP